VKVLFLDCDGVLNSYDGMHVEYERVKRCVFRWLEPRLVSLFTSWANAHPDINIVMSSSWRNWYKSMQELRQDMWDRGIKIDSRRWIDRTLYFPNAFRGAEIKDWLRDHLDVQHIAILDDSIDMEDLLPYLIKTDADVGVTGFDLLRVKDMLRVPLRIEDIDWSQRYEPKHCILRELLQ
jgi:hypothetical protein